MRGYARSRSKPLLSADDALRAIVRKRLRWPGLAASGLDLRQRRQPKVCCRDSVAGHSGREVHAIDQPGEDLDLQPDSVGSSCKFRNSVLPGASAAGFQSTATRTALDISSCRSLSRLASSSVSKKLNPVTFPPGRARLATRPTLTGSSETVKTIGIVAVAASPITAALLAQRPRTRGLRRPDHGSDVTVLEDQSSGLVQSADDNVHHGTGQIIGPDHLIGKH
jgi:hypothetical protein